MLEGVNLTRAQLGVAGRTRTSSASSRSSATARRSAHDDGQNDMYAAMKTYYDVGFRGPIRPDHVPTVTGFEENRFPGYNDLGALFAIGYIKGLMEAAMKASQP